MSSLHRHAKMGPHAVPYAGPLLQQAHVGLVQLGGALLRVAGPGAAAQLAPCRAAHLGHQPRDARPGLPG